MSLPKSYAGSKHWDRIHQQKRINKITKIQTLRALLEMWEAIPDQADHDYLRELRARLRSAENQYNAMKP